MGRTSIYGVIPLSYTRDHSGPLARDAMDAAIMMTIMAGPDPNDVRTLGLPPVPFDILGLPELAVPIGFTAIGADPKVPSGTIIGG